MKKGEEKSKVNILFILSFILLTSIFLVSSIDNLGIFKQGDCVSLYQLCDNCTFVNVTNVKVDGENNTIYHINQEMEKSGVDYNYTFCNTTFLGEYSYSVCGDKNGEFICELITFTITKRGTILETSESLIYILLTITVGILVLLGLYFSISTPYKNEVDNRGAIIKVTKLKYFKMLFIVITYALLVWLLNLLVGISDNFVNLRMYYGLISFLFTVLINLTIPVGIFILVLGLFEIVRDANIYENLKKFGSAK